MPKIVDHDERRAALLDALWRVVEHDGAEAVTVRSVAAEAGVSKSNVGHYYPTRAALLSAAVAQQLGGVQQRFDSVLSKPLDADAAAAAVLLAVPVTAARRRQSQVWLLLLADAATDPAVRPALDQVNRSVRAAADRLVSAMSQRGLLGSGRSVADESARLHALVDGLSVQTLSDERFMPAWHVRDLVHAHVRDMGAPRPDDDPSPMRGPIT